MKTNLSKFLFSALFILGVSPAFSQLSVGANIGIPTGDWSNYWGLGWGIDGRYEAPIQTKLNWTASIGYFSFGGKSYLGTSFPSISAVPLVGGIKYYFQESNKGVYAGADIGLYFMSASFGGSTGSTTRFGFAPALGYRIQQFDFSFRYNAVSDFNFVGLRAAYIIPGTK
jgi:hypothetical protein